MKAIRYVLLPVCLITLMITTASGALASDQEQAMKRIAELKRDISLLNLLNGLHLTSDQQSALLQDAQNAQKIAENYKLRFNELFPQTEKSLEDLKSQLLTGELPPGSPIEDRAKQANDEMKRMRESYLNDIAIVERHASAILTDGQKEIVEEFKPCLVPPRNLKNPTRAGQANDSSRLERMLAKVRTMPDDIYEARIDKIIDRQITKYEEHYGPLGETREAEKERIRSTIDEARAMSEVDFELNKEDLARQIDLQAANAHKEKNILLTEGDRPGKLSRFLLDERIIPLLEQKTASANTLQLSTKPALGSLQPAEDCRVQCGSKQ